MGRDKERETDKNGEKRDVLDPKKRVCYNSARVYPLPGFQ